VSIARRGGPAPGRPRSVRQRRKPASVELGSALDALWRRIVYTHAPPPDEEFMLELRRRLKPEVQALSEYLGRDLVALWGYDRIG
jgi:hypothetical protein